ncbi:unnamed protein product [Effrenium voratum]|nr:unnamed protein product [Effrenium voratum]
MAREQRAFYEHLAGLTREYERVVQEQADLRNLLFDASQAAYAAVGSPSLKGVKGLNGGTQELIRKPDAVFCAGCTKDAAEYEVSQEPTVLQIVTQEDRELALNHRSEALLAWPELPSEYLLGSPKSSLRSQSPSARSPSNSNRSPRSQARAWKKADPQESLSLEDLRGLLRLKEQAIRLLQEEVVELHGSLESQRQVEARYRHLDALLTQEEQEKPAGHLLEKIGNAVKKAQMHQLHAVHAGVSHGYPEFEAASLPYPVDQFGAQKRGILPQPKQPAQRSSWLY